MVVSFWTVARFPFKWKSIFTSRLTDRWFVVVGFVNRQTLTNVGCEIAGSALVGATATVVSSVSIKIPL